MELPSQPINPNLAPPSVAPLPSTRTMMSEITLWQKFWMGLATIIFVIFAISYFPRLLIKPAQITAIGVGEVDFQPDEVSMVISKGTLSDNSTQAITQGDAEAQSLINTVKTIAPDSEISRSFYQAAPTVGVTGKRVYQVANAFSVKFSDVSQASTMIQALYADGATRVSNVNFSSSVKEIIEQEAREKAVVDAKAKAKKIAKAAGKRLGRIVAISDDYRSANSTISSSDSAVEGSNFSNVAITKNVSIVYEVW